MLLHCQINFERSVVVTSVLLQGEGDQRWVTKFAIQGSKDGVEWRYVDEDGLVEENPLVFKGNQNGASVVEVRKHYFNNTLIFMKVVLSRVYVSCGWPLLKSFNNLTYFALVTEVHLLTITTQEFLYL